MPDAADEGQTGGTAPEPLCNDCLLAHIERLVSDRSRARDQEGGFMEQTAQRAA